MATFLTPTNIMILGIGIITLLSLAISKNQWNFFTYYLITIGFLYASHSGFSEFFQNLINRFSNWFKFDEADLRCFFFTVPFIVFVFCGFIGLKIFKDAIQKKHAQKQRYIAGSIYVTVVLVAFSVPRGIVIDTLLLSGAFVALYFHDWLLSGVGDDMTKEHKGNNEKEIMALLSQIQGMIDRGEGQMWDNFFMRGNILIGYTRDNEAERDFEQIINLLLTKPEKSEQERLYIEKSYVRLAQIKARRGDKKGAKGNYAMALSYSNEPQSYIPKMKELETSNSTQATAVNYKLLGICFIVSLFLSMCTKQELSTGLVAPIELRSGILVGEWQFKTTQDFKENVIEIKGDVEFKEDGTFKRTIKANEFNRTNDEYIGGGFIKGNYEIIEGENTFVWIEKTKICSLGFSSNSYNDLCPAFKTIKYGDVREKKVLKTDIFTRNKILITGENLTKGNKLTYELTRK